MMRFSRFLKTLYSHFTRLAWSEAGLHNRAGSAGDAEVTPGDVLYYIAATRLDPAEVNWRAVA